MELRWGYLLAYMIAVPLYVLITLSAPTDTTQARYNISSLSLFMLQVSIIVPVILIWLAGLKGAGALQVFARAKQAQTEGPALTWIVRGIQILVAGLIINSLFGSLRSHVINNHDALVAFQIVANYLAILFPLVGISAMYVGSRRLLTACKFKAVASRTRITIIVLTLVLAAVITMLVLQNPARNQSSDPTVASYFLSDPLIFLTILLPNFAIWLIGGLTVLNVRQYAKLVTGTAYKIAFKRLAFGLTALIGLQVVIELFASFSVALSKINLGLLLLIVYLLLGLYGAAYLFIAWAARTLHQVEHPATD